MKTSFPIFFLLLIQYTLLSQNILDETKKNHTFSVVSFNDFTKNAYYPMGWFFFDQKGLTFEIRYNYNSDKNISAYIGQKVFHKDWELKYLEGFSCGKNKEISFSPIQNYDGKKINFNNSAQINLALTNSPSYLLQWAELSYKFNEVWWLGVSNRTYFEKLDNLDFALGAELTINIKDFFISNYLWLPSKYSENIFSIQIGYNIDY